MSNGNLRPLCAAAALIVGCLMAPQLLAAQAALDAQGSGAQRAAPAAAAPGIPTPEATAATADSPGVASPVGPAGKPVAAPHGATVTVVVFDVATLLVDGVAVGDAEPHQANAVTDLPVGTHTISARYSDGHIETLEQRVTDPSEIAHVVFPYRVRPSVIRFDDAGFLSSAVFTKDSSVFPLGTAGQVALAVDALTSVPGVRTRYGGLVADLEEQTDRLERLDSTGWALLSVAAVSFATSTGAARDGNGSMQQSAEIAGTGALLAELVANAVSQSILSRIDEDFRAIVNAYNAAGGGVATE